MDPLSITTGCVALLTNLVSAGLAISNFIQDYKEAAEDLVTITRELAEMRTIASTLQRDCNNSSASSIPVGLRPQTADILKNCDAVVLQVQGLVDKYMASGKTGAAKWALRGKDDVTKLQVSLETHRNTLSLTLGMISVSLTKAVKDDTTVIKEGMAEVREIATHVLKGVETLRKLEGVEQPGDRLDLGGRFMMLERYLQDMTSYADTVIGEDLWEDTETHSIQVTLENMPDDHDSQRITQAEAKVVQSSTTPKLIGDLTASQKDDQQAERHSMELVGESPASGSNSGQASVEDAGQADQPEPPPPSTFVYLGGHPPIKPVKLQRGTTHVVKTIAVVGAYGGKTKLIRTFVERKYPPEYLLPSGIDHYCATLDIGCELSLSIMDIPGYDDYQRLRQTVYGGVGADLFLICADLGDPDTLDLAGEYYVLTGEPQFIQEVREVCPKTPVVLVGCKKDVRDCPERKWPDKEVAPVSWATGEAMARKIGAAMYMECSAKTGEGVDAVFLEPLKVMFSERVKKSLWSKILERLKHDN